MRASRLVVVAALGTALVLIGGCASKKQRGSSGESIADLVRDLPTLSVPEGEPVRPSREEVLAAYEQVYGLIPNSTDNHAVGKRLADLKMSVGEERDIAGVEDPYRDAVTLYESLLDSAEEEGRDQILYQLARAHDLVGETDAAVGYLNRLIEGYPDSSYALEARFRRAEIHFSRGEFRGAERDYGVVVASGRSSPYWQNATYMQGWAQFKLGDLDEGLSSFFNVVDSILAGKVFEDLPPTEQELLADSLRVVTLALEYLDGPQTLAAHMQTLDRPAWQYAVYKALADDYLVDERYLDSVATWQTFIEQNALDARAPSAHIGMIETLMAADFPSEVQPKKEEFVSRYGVYSEFWSIHDESVRAGYLTELHTYLKELANVAHGKAQESGRGSDYLAAAEWYDEIVVTFPDDPSTAEYLFLLGEVYTEAGEHGRAVASYQRVVHEFIDYPRADEAGYAAILGLTELVDTAPVEELELWQRLKIDAQIEFAMLFSADERAPAVQGAAADSLFVLGEYEEAVNLADNLLATWPDAPVELRSTSLKILGHGYFELGNYVAAESAYERLLLLPMAESEHADIEERLLAAVYKQGEAAEAQGDADTAVAHYLRLAEIDPTAPLAAKGQFDAVAVVEGTGDLEQAAVLLEGFRASYPDHELNRDVEKRLAGMYEQTGDWRNAAEEYVTLADTADDPEVRRQSRYRAAELYLDLNDQPMAMAQFDAYARTYQQPLDQNLEAVHHLDLLSQAAGDEQQRRYWLDRKIDIHRRMGTAATERATYFAAEAQYVFAEDERMDYEVIRLTNPLPKSLKRKQQALKETVRAYEAVADYQVAAFSTASTFQIANLYASLSRSIMESDRPPGLSELELEQYEILLEEQAFPFEEQAIALHEINMRRSWEGVYDDWVKQSFDALRRLMPARFDKQEIDVAYVETIY
ncbi:MAG: tetratricopeptide repeat protein [Pseudomonadales bacterium]